MKKFALILALFGIVLFQGESYAVAPPEPGNGIKLNNVVKGGLQDEATKVYVLVRNSDQGANNSSISSGDVVVWDQTSDDGLTVVKSSASNDGAIAGIAVTTIETDDTGGTTDVGGRNWGYIQVYGVGSANTGAGGTNGHAVGDRFITSSDSAKVTGYEGTVTAAELANGESGGFFLDAADGTSTSYDVFINLM